MHHELIAALRETDLQRQALKIEYRRQWHAFNALDRLESAVKRARRAVRVGGPVTAGR